MGHRWLQSVLFLVLTVALVAAPCVHCRTVTVEPAQQTAPGHDCCPKSQQSQDDSGCAWLPALYAPSDGKVIKVDLQTLALTPAALTVADRAIPLFAPHFVETSAPPPSAPPLYISNAAFLI